MRLFVGFAIFICFIFSFGCVKDVQGPSFIPTTEGTGWDFGSSLGMNSRSQASPVKIGDRIFLTMMEGAVYAFDAEKGKQIDPKTCSFRIPQGIRSSPVEKDAVIYFGAFDKKLHAFDTKSCQEIFSFETNGYISATPLIVDNTIYFGSYDGKFRAIDLTSRRLSWEYDCGSKIRGGASKTTDGVVFGSAKGNVINLNRSNGAELWVFESKGEIYGAPVAQSEIVVFGSRDGEVRALYESNGALYWEFTPPENGYKYKEEFWISPTVDETTAYIGSTWGVLYALKLRPESGKAELVWEPFATKDKIGRSEYIFSEAVINGDNILFGCNDGNLYCVDRLTGTKRWGFETFGEIRSKPLVDGDRVIFPSNDHYFYALNISDGQPVRGKP